MEEAGHVIEIWEMVGDKRTIYTPVCLSCGWFGSDGTMVEAQGEIEMHERGERPPWVHDPSQPIVPWRPGDPTTRPPRR